tara:strand:+ start:7764 stop:8132 length:369 start_codon:yes stop_codon:yes gene_type:complete
MANDIGTGTTIVFGTSGWTAEILDVGWGGISRESIEMSHMGTTTARIFVPTDLYDPGELTIEFLYDPAEDPPFAGAAETVTVTYPGAATMIATGFMTNLDIGVPFEDRMTGTGTIKFTGAIT